MTRPIQDEPFVHGILIGVLLPMLALLFPLFRGELSAWFEEGAVYGLMPVFAVLGIPAYVVTRVLRGPYQARGRRALHLTHGLALGGWLVGASLMWSAQVDKPVLGRAVGSLTGGLMLVAFWLWIGSILAHFQPGAESGPADQSQSLTSRPK